MRHGVNKNNVAWWFAAIVCLVVAGLIATAWSGLVTIDASWEAIAGGWDQGRLRALGIYLVAINVLTAGVFAWDKRIAVRGDDHARRVPEARLLALSLAGGAVGALAAMSLVHHKTQKWYFAWGLPCLVVLHAAVVLYAHLAGLL